MSLIAGIDHVQITVPVDGEIEARMFYIDLLGMTEVRKPASLAGRGGFWARAGTAMLHVGVEDGVDRTATKAHIAWHVHDLAAVRQRLDDANYQLQAGIPIPGYVRAELRDPFGNRVEFIQPV